MNRKQFLSAAGVEGATLEIWIEQGWLMPREADADTMFGEIDIARAHLIHELQHDMGANDAGIDIILHLMDQMHGMRRLMRDMRDQIEAQAKRGV
ncbi:hypothetical protein BZU93_28600 [Salmonella enterica subsp. enterica]|nr:hypothetical protein [Escherichia coli]MIL09825.1 hypothetical protein [Salmonella enterica subsp. enterica serovar Enteritidis]